MGDKQLKHDFPLQCSDNRINVILGCTNREVMSRKSDFSSVDGINEMDTRILHKLLVPHFQKVC